MNANVVATEHAMPLPAAAWPRGLAAPWQTASAWARAAIFLQKLQGGISEGVARVKRNIVAADGMAFNADEYWPQRDAAVALPTILLVHGLSPLAHRDMRIVNLARALAASGFRVIAPEFAEVRALTIGPSTIDNIARCMRAVALEHETVNHRVGVFSASFCGGLSVLAAGRQEAASWVAGITAIGSYTDVASTLQYLMSSEKADPYGRYVILKNFIHHSIGDDAEVQLALTTAIDDNFHGRSPGELPVLLQRLRPRAVNLVQALLHDAATRRYHFDRIRPHLKKISEPLDVVRNAGGVKAPVWLLHGEEDNVIPANQSRLLHVALRRAGKRSTLVVSPLLSHSNVRLGMQAAGQAVQLLGAVAGYFRAVTHPVS